MADVFTTLCAYSGMRSFWRVYRFRNSPEEGYAAGLVFSFVKIGGRWVVFDLYNRKYFLNDKGRLASLEELKEHPELIQKTAGDLKIREIECIKFFKDINQADDSKYFRPDTQMVLKRL